MAFFDAWRITPTLKLAPDAQMYGEPQVDDSPERDQWDVEAERTVASQMEHYSSRQETPKDQHAFEISKAALDALKDLDEGLRTELGDNDAIDVKKEATLNHLGLAIADVTAGGPFAKITFGIQQVCSRYEGLLKLLYAEFYLRDHPLPYSRMKEY